MAGTIQIEFPDCGEINSNDTGQHIVVQTDNCVAVPPGPPPVISWWETLIIGIVALSVIIGAAIVRYRAHELKPERLEQKRLARKQEIDGQVEIAKARKVCRTCGDKYEPELKR
ncbi:hypothetical protein SEA_HANNACONDA_134 [Mycobacterium phage Hannaconda]|nr:hypothetical protein SEA_HANNACONDA_134 [Mycobacterium phage Hannaconda]